MAFILKDKDTKLDYCKRQILSVQEDYKIFLPLLIAVSAVIIVLNVFNAVNNFMSVYVCALLNIIGLVVAGLILYKLISGNIKQKACFARLSSQDENEIAFVEAMYVQDSLEILKNAKRVRLISGEESYIVKPILNFYRHRFFTRYKFTDDFGQLELPKCEYLYSETNEGEISLSSAEHNIVFKKIENKTGA